MEILAGFELLAVVLQRIICQENLRGCIIQPTFFFHYFTFYILLQVIVIALALMMWYSWYIIFQ